MLFERFYFRQFPFKKMVLLGGNVLCGCLSLFPLPHSVFCSCSTRVTVNHIEKNLPVESKVAWRSRSNVDYVVLFDWKCSASDIKPGSCIASLYDAITKVIELYLMNLAEMVIVKLI